MRLPDYDYSSAGAYFVTICLQERQPLLDDPVLQGILQETWYALPQRFPGIRFDEFVIMPDHLHFIVWLHPEGTSRPTLGDVVKAFKSLTGRAALDYLRMREPVSRKRFWQLSYYDHVIRNEADLEEKITYMRNNPIKAELKRQR